MGAHPDMVVPAHDHSSRHRHEIEKSERCGCFYCLAVFSPEQICEWTDDKATALCPHCGIYSVVGDKSGFQVASIDFLTAMKAYWFDRTVTMPKG